MIILGASLLLTSLACQLQLGGPQPPERSPEIAPDTSSLLDQAWASAIGTAGQNGDFTFNVDESQLNGFVREKLEAQVNPSILQPQVFLRQGQIQLYGESTQGPVRARIHVSIQPKIDSDGRLAFEVPSAEFGPFPAPRAFKEAVARSMNELLADTVGPFGLGFRVRSVDIHDGKMAIVATIR